MASDKPIRMLREQEEKELLGLGEELLLSEFPNPERLGCPGTETLRSLAFQSKRIPLPERNRHLDHLTCCSACFGEFSSFVDQARRRKRLMVVGICALLVATIGLGAWLAMTQWNSRQPETITHTPPSPRGPEPEREPEEQKLPQPSRREQPTEIAYRNVTLDVRDQAVTRGPGPPPIEEKYPTIPRGLLNLSIYLPFGSQAGKYHLAIYKDQAGPLLTTKGIARIHQGATIVRIKVDTRQMSPGSYALETRHADWTSGYEYTFVIAE